MRALSSYFFLCGCLTLLSTLTACGSNFYDCYYYGGYDCYWSGNYYNWYSYPWAFDTTALPASAGTLRKTSSASLYTGQWHLLLSQNSGSCPSFPPSISTSVNVKQNKKKITLTIPGLANIKGYSSARGFSAKYTFHPTSYSCRGNIKLEVTNVAYGAGKASAKVYMSCPSGLKCSMSLKGGAHKS